MWIAITGGICDGKSTLLAALSELGHATVSADEVVSDMYSDPVFLDRVRVSLGQEFVEGGQIKRAMVADHAFRDAQFRRRLNALTHPEVTRRMLGTLESFGARIAFAEVPLLVEASLQGLFDRVWVVDAGPAERLRRLTAKLGGDESAAKARLSTQLPTEAKKAFADRIVRTNSGLESVKILAANLAGAIS